MRFSCSSGGHIGLFSIRPPGAHPNLFAMVFRNLLSIPITIPNFKNLSPSARFDLYMAYSSPAISYFCDVHLHKLKMNSRIVISDIMTFIWRRCNVLILSCIWRHTVTCTSFILGTGVVAITSWTWTPLRIAIFCVASFRTFILIWKSD